MAHLSYKSNTFAITDLLLPETGHMSFGSRSGGDLLLGVDREGFGRGSGGDREESGANLLPIHSLF